MVVITINKRTKKKRLHKYLTSIFRWWFCLYFISGWEHFGHFVCKNLESSVLGYTNIELTTCILGISIQLKHCHRTKIQEIKQSLYLRYNKTDAFEIQLVIPAFSGSWMATNKVQGMSQHIWKNKSNHHMQGKVTVQAVYYSNYFEFFFLAQITLSSTCLLWCFLDAVKKGVIWSLQQWFLLFKFVWIW